MNYHEMSGTKKSNCRKSGFLLSGITSVIYILLFFRGKHLPYLFVVAAVLAILAVFEVWPLHKLIELFLGFGNYMHRFTNPIVFGLIYIVAVIPTSLVLKCLGKDVLQLRYDRTSVSYWKYYVNNSMLKKSFLNQY